MDESRPVISIVVSIYNSADTLARCLESLVYQSLQNIEIILVDKASTDGSNEIEELYQRNFPDKFRLFYRPYSPNTAAGRNFGIAQARADYVAFADADDWYELNAMELLYNSVQEDPADIVFYPWKFLDENGKVTKIGRHPKELTVSAQLRTREMMSFWNKLFRRELLAAYLPMPEVIADDATFLPIVISYAKKLSAMPTPVYCHGVTGGLSSVKINKTAITILDGWDYLLANANPQYMEEIVGFIGVRARIALNKYRMFKWEYIRWLKEHKSLFLYNEILKKDAKLYNFLANAIDTQEDLIPQIIYINGFGHGDLSTRVEEIRATAFTTDSGSIVVLDEHNCSLDESGILQKAYTEGRFSFLGEFFATQRIFETGGFYIGDSIRLKAPLTPVLDKPAFFSYVTKNTISSEFWGAKPGNAVIGELCCTYAFPGFYEDAFTPLAERLKNILTACFGLPLDGREIAIEDKAFLADARIAVLNDEQSPFVCEQDFTQFAGEDGYRVIPEGIAYPVALSEKAQIRSLELEREKLKADIEKLKSVKAMLQQGNDALKKGMVDLKKKVSSLEKKNKKLELKVNELEAANRKDKKKLKSIYSSASWRLVQMLKRFGATPFGRPLKWLAKKLMGSK